MKKADPRSRSNASADEGARPRAAPRAKVDARPADDGSEEVEIARVLLRKDLFASVRSREALETLVERAVATVPAPYAMLLCRLLGYHPMADQERARTFWRAIVAHRDELAARLGRDVHLRVAAMDLIAQGLAPEELGSPIIVGPRVLRRILRVVDAATAATLRPPAR